MAVHGRRTRAREVLSAAQNYRRVIPGAVVPAAAETLSAPQRAAIEAPRASLADLKSLAAEHGYDVVRRDV